MPGVLSRMVEANRDTIKEQPTLDLNDQTKAAKKQFLRAVKRKKKEGSFGGDDDDDNY